MKIQKSILFLILLIFVQIAAQQTEHLKGDKKPKINKNMTALLEKYKEQYKIPALTAFVIDLKKKTRYAITGTTFVDGEDTVELEDKWHIGSNTKAIFTFIAKRLEKQGLFSFNNTILQVLPELESQIKPAYHNKTFAQLVSHNAGIYPFQLPSDIAALPAFNGTIIEQRLQFAAYALSTFDPLTEWHYSNGGFPIASCFLERVTGKSFEELLAEQMSELGIEYITGFPNKESPSNPWGHLSNGQGGLIPIAPDNPFGLPKFALPTGDVSMSPLQYSKWARLHVEGLMGHQPQLTKEEFLELHYGLDQYAYGWENNRRTNVTTSRHIGSAFIFYCILEIDLQQNFAVFTSMNSGAEEHKAPLHELHDLLWNYADSILLKFFSLGSLLLVMSIML